jgi:hypothetical protein
LNHGGGEIFRTCPERPWGPPSLLYNGYRLFPGVKPPGRGVDHPPSLSAEVKERVQLYLYSPLWAFVACSRVNFSFIFVGHASTFVEVAFNKNIPIVQLDIQEKISVFVLKFPCLRLTETKFTKCVAHELTTHSVT